MLIVAPTNLFVGVLELKTIIFAKVLNTYNVQDKIINHQKTKTKR